MNCRARYTGNRTRQVCRRIDSNGKRRRSANQIAPPSFYPALFDNKEFFFNIGFDFRFYSPLIAGNNFIVAFRLASEKNFGNYPFFASVFLGGKNSLRGYNRERFAGDASFFTQLEFRAYLTTLKVIVPARFGINLLTEMGRVFTSNLSSDKWHPTYGGGMWLSFLEREVNFVFTVAFSPEEEQYYLSTRMGF
jgi:hemolysin activation/secretion protein